MSKEFFFKENGSKYFSLIVAAILQIAVTFLSIALFSAVIYFTEKGYEFAAIFATVSVALGAFSAAFYISKKQKGKAFYIGATVGGVTFFVITLISLISDSGALTVNTLFHFIIIMLASLIGAVLGVGSSKEEGYI